MNTQETVDVISMKTLWKGYGDTHRFVGLLKTFGCFFTEGILGRHGTEERFLRR